MKEFEAKNYDATYGQMNVHMRIIGKKIYLRTSNNPQVIQMITKLRDGGAEVIEGTNGWVQIDMFKGRELVRLGGREFDASIAREEDVEIILYDFYTNKYREAHYVITEIKK